MAKKKDENDDFEPKIAEKDLKKLLPKGYTLNKTVASRADLLFEIERKIKEESNKLTPLEEFAKKLRQWFIQELPAGDASGIAGTVARVEITRSEIGLIKDSKKFYDYIIKNRAFDLLNKAPNQAAIRERWEAKKVIPGLEKMQVKKISLTKVKGKK